MFRNRCYRSAPCSSDGGANPEVIGGYLSNPRLLRLSSRIGLAPISTLELVIGNVVPSTVRNWWYLGSTVYLEELQVPWSQLSAVSHIAWAS